MAIRAAIGEAELPAGISDDSHNLLLVLKEEENTNPLREATPHQASFPTPGETEINLKIIEKYRNECRSVPVAN